MSEKKKRPWWFWALAIVGGPPVAFVVAIVIGTIVGLIQTAMNGGQQPDWLVKRSAPPAPSAAPEKLTLRPDEVPGSTPPPPTTSPQNAEAPREAVSPPSYAPPVDPPPELQYNGPVQVRGYTRKDGTYVRPHTRRR